MLRQDYIIRQIEQLVRFVARLLRLLKQQSAQQAGDEIDLGLRNLSGLSLELIKTLSLRGLLDMMRSGDKTDVFRSLAVAELLNIHAEVCQRRGADRAALTARVKALTLYMEALISFRHPALAEPEIRAQELIGLLSEVELPRDTAIRICRYYLAIGRFADAEDLLFEMIETGTGGSATVTEGVAMLEGLLERSDSELEAGNLPRDEVEEALQQLKARA
jgi:hypothetical protein